MNIFRNFFYTTCLSCIALAATPADLPAEEGPESLTLSLSGILERIRTHNPELAAARFGIEEARGRMEQAGRLQNPEIAGAYRDETDSPQREFGVELTQAFPVTARLRLEKEVTLAELRAAEAEVREVERQLVAEAREAAIRLLAVRQQRALRTKHIEVVDELAELLEKAAAKGEHSILDAGQARVESTQHSLEIGQLDAETEEILGELKNLLNLDAPDKLTVTGSLPQPSLPSGTLVDLSQRPDYAAAELLEQAARREVALEKARKFDDVGVSLFAERVREEDAPVGLENETWLGVKLSIPLPLWNKNRGAVQEKTAKSLRLEQEKLALANDIHNEVGTTRKLMTAHATLVRKIDTKLLPLARKQVDLTVAAFENGQSDLQPVLRARDQQIRLEVARLDALRDFNVARIRYEAAVAGPPLPLAPASSR